MNVVIFGATGMIGQGAMRECLLDADVKRVVSIVRKPAGRSDPKLREIVHTDFLNYTAIEGELKGLDACFFCLGVASAGMSEADYRKVTYGYTLAAAETLMRLNPGMTFIYVSGAGADSAEKSRVMWARVRGETENALLRLPFGGGAYVVRPAFVMPMHGIQSRTPLYRIFYSLLGWTMPLVRWIAPGFVTSTEQMGHAMLKIVREGAPKRVLESADLQRF